MVKIRKKVVLKKQLEDYPNFNYSKILQKCIKDCKRWKIPISNKIKKSVKFIRQRNCYALCEKLYSGYFQISYTTAGFDEYGISKKAIYNLFMHELCHTILNCFNHLKEWKMWVKKLNEHGCKINPYPFSSKKTEYKDYY